LSFNHPNKPKADLSGSPGFKSVRYKVSKDVVSVRLGADLSDSKRSVGESSTLQLRDKHLLGPSTSPRISEAYAWLRSG